MQPVSARTRKILINVGGFGFGILWVLKDEMESPRIFRIPQAATFADEELLQWNQTAGPKGPWAVPDAEVQRMNAAHFVARDESSDPVSNTW